MASLSALQLPNGVDQTEEGGTKSSLGRVFRSNVACVVCLFVVFLLDHRSHIEGEVGKRLRWMVRAWRLSFSRNTSIYDVSFPGYWRKHELCVDQNFNCFDQSFQSLIYLRIRINDFDTNPSPRASLASSSPNAPFQHVETLSLENKTILPQFNPHVAIFFWSWAGVVWDSNF